MISLLTSLTRTPLRGSKSILHMQRPGSSTRLKILLKDTLELYINVVVLFEFVIECDQVICNLRRYRRRPLEHYAFVSAFI